MWIVRPRKPDIFTSVRHTNTEVTPRGHTWCSHAPLVHCSVHVTHNASQQLAVLGVLPEQTVHERRLLEEAEHRVDPAERLVREVPGHDGLEARAALGQRLGQEGPVVAEVHLVEADHGHGGRVETLLEALGRAKFVRRELLVPVQKAQLDDDLYDVLDQLLSLLLAARLETNTPLRPRAQSSALQVT